MSEQSFTLLELGSNSLKHYVVSLSTGSESSIQTRKIPWEVAHDFYRHGELVDSTVQHIVDTLREADAYSSPVPLGKSLCFATGVFREFTRTHELEKRVRDEVGVRIRVMSGVDEARLMAKGFRPGAPSVLLCDVGGATTEWAWFDGGVARRFGSLKLGCIRSLYADPQSAAHALADFDAAGVLPDADVVGTGGICQTLASLVGAPHVSLGDLQNLREQIASNGAPRSVPAHRARILDVGIGIVESLVKRSGREVLVVAAASSVRSGLAERLVHALQRRDAEDMKATMLLESTHLRRDEID